MGLGDVSDESVESLIKRSYWIWCVAVLTATAICLLIAGIGSSLASDTSSLSLLGWLALGYGIGIAVVMLAGMVGHVAGGLGWLLPFVTFGIAGELWIAALIVGGLSLGPLLIVALVPAPAVVLVHWAGRRGLLWLCLLAAPGWLGFVWQLVAIFGP